MGWTCRSCKCYRYHAAGNKAMEIMRQYGEKPGSYKFYDEKLTFEQLEEISKTKEVWIGWCKKHKMWIHTDPEFTFCEDGIDRKEWSEYIWIEKKKC